MSLKKSAFLVPVLLAMTACGTTGDKQPRAVDIGYGQAKNESLPYAVSTLEMKEVDKTSYTTIYDYLEGRVPGVQVVKTGTATASVYIRGVSTINGSPDPLFVVDGVTVSDISYINPRDVKSVTVLKDASAAIYGVNGANGVIVIKLKR